MFVVLLGALLVFLILVSGTRMIFFMDPVSLLSLVVPVIPALVQAGLLGDFNNSFRLTVGKKKGAAFKEIKRAIEALGLARKTTAYMGAFVCSISIIVILGSLDDLSALGPNVAVAVLSIVYATAFNVLLLPLEKQLKVRLIEFDEEALEKEKRLEEKQTE